MQTFINYIVSYIITLTFVDMEYKDGLLDDAGLDKEDINFDVHHEDAHRHTDAHPLSLTPDYSYSLTVTNISMTYYIGLFYSISLWMTFNKCPGGYLEQI